MVHGKVMVLTKPDVSFLHAMLDVSTHLGDRRRVPTALTQFLASLCFGTNSQKRLRELREGGFVVLEGDIYIVIDPKVPTIYKHLAGAMVTFSGTLENLAENWRSGVRDLSERHLLEVESSDHGRDHPATFIPAKRVRERTLGPADVLPEIRRRAVDGIIEISLVRTIVREAIDLDSGFVNTQETSNRVARLVRALRTEGFLTEMAGGQFRVAEDLSSGEEVRDVVNTFLRGTEEEEPEEAETSDPEEPDLAPEPDPESEQELLQEPIPEPEPTPEPEPEPERPAEPEPASTPIPDPEPEPTPAPAPEPEVRMGELVEFPGTEPSTDRPLSRLSYSTDQWLRLQILRDHLYVQAVNEQLYGSDRLLERTSLAVFDHHHQGAINARGQRNRWKDRGYLRTSDEAVYCRGCRWRVDDEVILEIIEIAPSISREEAERYIEFGREEARRDRPSQYKKTSRA